MRVFLLSRGYPTSTDPAWGCFERDHALVLKQKGHEVVVFSVDKRFRVGGHWGISHEVADDINIYDCRLFPSRLLLFLSPRLLVFLYSFFCLWTFRKAVKDNGLPDVIFSHYLANTVILKRVKKKYGIPILAMEHWSMVMAENRPRYVDIFAKSGYILADKIISVSNALHNRLLELYNVDSIVINNIISPEFNDTSWREHDGFTFISIGRIVEGKGYDTLIHAFAKSGLITSNVQLTIIGEDGGEKSKLELLVQSLGLTEYVHFVGGKTKTEIAHLLSNSDAFVLASRSETFGVVYIEAMLFGLPVIGTRCGGPEEIITNQNGMLVNVDDINQLSDALVSMYHDINKYDRESISKDCSTKYSADVIYEKVVRCMYDIINKS